MIKKIATRVRHCKSGYPRYLNLGEDVQGKVGGQG